MSLLTDILEALQEWPKWKRITEAPERLAGIERRLAALEGKFGERPAIGCQFCGGVMRIEGVRPDKVLGDMGVQVETWRCETCGKTTERQVEPEG